MFSGTLSYFWPQAAERSEVRPQPPKPRRAPVFVGDAVQPWGSGTMLLAILRQQAAKDEGDD